MTLALKGKIFIMDPESQNKTLVILPKSFDLTTLKIYKGEDEQFLEQMLVQSLLGVQMEQMKKTMKPKPIPLKEFVNPAEFQCIGFNLTNLDVLINKGYLQLNANYKETAGENEEFCQGFESTLKSSPEKMLELLSGKIPGLNSLKNKFGGGDDDDEEGGKGRKKKEFAGK